jgi:hypothetical protein
MEANGLDLGGEDDGQPSPLAARIEKPSLSS